MSYIATSRDFLHASSSFSVAILVAKIKICPPAPPPDTCLVATPPGNPSAFKATQLPKVTLPEALVADIQIKPPPAEPAGGVAPLASGPR